MTCAKSLVLPQEILEHILDFLHDDVQTLRACALAARVFLQTSRYHRFNGLALAYPRTSRLSNLLSVSPDLAWSIKSLRLTSATHLALDSDLRLLQHLPALTDLSVIGPVLTSIAAHAPNLTTLRVRWTRSTASCKYLIFGIADFLSLEELELVDIRLSSQDVSSPEYPAAPPLRKLRFKGGDCAAAICGWLAAVESIPPFHSLSHDIRERRDAEEFVQLAETLSPLVHELTLRFIPEGNMNDALADTALTLCPFTVLRSCTLRFAFGEMCVPQNTSLPWIPTIIGQLSSSHLQTLRISLAVDNVEDLRSLASECAVRVISPAYFDDMRFLDWEGIERALVSEQLRGITRVLLEGRGSRTALENHIKTLCPELHSRGILLLVPVEGAPWLD
ncbi:hypothetical protein OH76DRAFT_477854 [Lentinus brumalis]|uniref:F-box domain-containing protein n=1 Tax=Lentinus brumalis TaxID=2498619 RepID=A0A371DBY0_9APHY|nr:hypothetical protein OH76DRAFT_477854 [Polyporus brumalis]